MLVLGDGAFYPADFVWFGGAWGAALGAWAGAMPIPLDWARVHPSPLGHPRVVHTRVVHSFAYSCELRGRLSMSSEGRLRWLCTSTLCKRGVYTVRHWGIHEVYTVSHR